MTEYKLIYESQESIAGYLPKSREWVVYKSVLRIKDGGKTPVTLEMTLVPPQPFLENMPETHRLQGKSVTDVYAKVVKLFLRYGIEFKS